MHYSIIISIFVFLKKTNKHYMNKIEYEIFLDKNDRPIIGMSDENIGKIENIFCILELAKFYI